MNDSRDKLTACVPVVWVFNMQEWGVIFKLIEDNYCQIVQ